MVNHELSDAIRQLELCLNKKIDNAINGSNKPFSNQETISISANFEDSNLNKPSSLVSQNDNFFSRLYSNIFGR
jgi:hypothetical protein